MTAGSPREERRRTWRLAARLVVAATLLHAPALDAQQVMLGRVAGVARTATEGRPARDVSVTLTRLEPAPVATRTTSD